MVYTTQKDADEGRRDQGLPELHLRRRSEAGIVGRLRAAAQGPPEAGEEAGQLDRGAGRLIHGSRSPIRHPPDGCTSRGGLRTAPQLAAPLWKTAADVAVITPTPVPRPSRHLSGLGTGRRPPGIVTDRLFRWVALASGLLVLVILGLIAYSTTKEAWPWFKEEGLGDLRRQLGPGERSARRRRHDLRHLPRRCHRAVHGGAREHRHRAVRHRGRAAPFRKPIIYTVDLLAAIPSVVYGLWALAVLRQPLADLVLAASRRRRAASRCSTRSSPSPSPTGLSYMTAGIIVAIMITPIITSITREVFATTPQPLKEASYGLGATRGR